jgi:hypothetical protein
MKHFLIALAVLAFIAATPEAHALFGHVAAEKDRREHAEQTLVQQQQLTAEQQRANGHLVLANQRLQTTIRVLAAGVTIALVIGAAIGSKTRRDATRS